MANIALKDAEALAFQALAASRIAPHIALSVAQALVAAEADGLASHGLLRLPYYADQALAGKVDGFAEPTLERPAASLARIDAHDGFAFPAITLALSEGTSIARESGIAAVGIGNSHHSGVMGFHVEAAAAQGFLALAFTNSQAAIAPWGGKTALFGTNPIAFATPRRSGLPVVIDLSVSKVARGKVMVARSKGEPIPLGWALDVEGNPTTDADAAMAGTMVPVGDAKGACLALMVEILAAGLTGANFSYQTSSMFDIKGPPPHLGQLFIVIDPQRLGGEDFLDRIDSLASAILAQPGTRLPGDNRLIARHKAQSQGLELPDSLIADLERRATS
jgi:(2R)-3-sulfolactate dehydrogenase (NADP+)